MRSADVVDMYTMPTKTLQLEDLAENLTRRLGVPFTPNKKGGVGFRDPLRLTSWSVPLVFDGHAAWDHGSLVPTDFVGHVLWAALRATPGPPPGEAAGAGGVMGGDGLLKPPAEPVQPKAKRRFNVA